MKKYTLPISYVILLSLCMPLACLWAWSLSFPFPWDALFQWADTVLKGLFVMFLQFLPIGVYWLAMLILGILNIVRSFRMYKSGDVNGCINGMLIHKYGLVIFFVVNFITLAIFYLVLSVGLLVGTRGMMLVFAPFTLPWLLAALGFTIFVTWLAIIPGSFYAIQVIRFTLREKKTSIGAAVWHGFLQFIFLADVLDAMYLAVKKWGKGKKSSVAVVAVYIACVAAIIWMIVSIRT